MRLRELGVEDYAGSTAVLERNGLRHPTVEQWNFFWRGSPHQEQLAGIPFGWVLEHETDGIVGTFRNAAFLYEWNRQPVRVAVASAWAVDETHRRHSLMLATEYFRQSHVDVLLNTTAVIETSGKAFLAFRAERVPQPAYTTRLLWITGYKGFAANLLRERGIPAVALGQYPTAAALWIGDASRRAWMSRATSSVHGVDGFDERFDRFWAEERERRDRLQPVRDSATLTWRYALERQPPLIAALERDGNLAGYTVFVHRPQGTYRRVEVADLHVRDDDPATVAELMAGSLRLARDRGIDLVALSGHADAKRRGLAALAPHTKTVTGWPLYYKAVNGALVELLRTSTTWDVSLSDGDALWSGVFAG